ncbi:sensor histidine kinase [Cruoricaptor ignavus]|uniref:Sensor histidine kinase n=1 Tax=Cruoricaptor ignavus TaxID=1118202 RepID=A0A7M1T088_9FLAO|nr:sensor histidine kinase [Cruoricaptor ignavus]QOR73171.1 sensor histidine kinase [Cruoricaptor ignavus]
MHFSKKIIFAGGAGIIAIFLTLALYAVYFSQQTVRKVRVQNIENEAHINSEMLRHEIHNLLELPRQIHFAIENSWQNNGQIRDTELQPLQNILEANPNFLNATLCTPGGKNFVLKGRGFEAEKLNSTPAVSVVPPSTLRYKTAGPQASFFVYDISLEELNCHLAENHLGSDQQAVVTLGSGQILFSEKPDEWGKILPKNAEFEWQGPIRTDLPEPLILYLKFSPEKISRGSGQISLMLYGVSALALLVLVMLYLFYQRNLSRERSVSYRLSEKNQQLQLENERRLKENALLQLQQIKTQINPHFLFNSLNSLKALIETESPKSNEFLQKLADVYRYVLKNNEGALAEISDEIQFVEEYFYLQKIRFGTALEMEISGNFERGKIPFLSLQTLVENAVKHNALSKNLPLKIEIRSDGERLTVKNNLNPKKNSPDASTGIGLEYIANIYRFHGRGGFGFLEENNYFVVFVPLIF